MNNDINPKVFISYSWSSNDIVMPLAERLVSHGVNVIIDKWELKEGQDKYEFMERCVSDEEITKVLIVCDKKYTEKANSRTDGVGDETVIISSEIYGNMRQEKFIPIIAEYDESGSPYVPTYIKTRIYIDLANEEKYEEEYEKLLRNIYEKPLYQKPKLGAMPPWLNEESKPLFPLEDLILQIKRSNNEKKEQYFVDKFIEKYIETLKTYYIEAPTGEEVFNCFSEMKQIRDSFLDFLDALIETNCVFSDVVGNAFEKMYNTLTNVKGFNPDAYHSNDSSFEIYKIHLYELFICTIVYLRYKEDYLSINGIVDRTYFLVRSSLDNRVIETNYCCFRHYSRIIEDEYKPTTEYKNKFSLLAYFLCGREKLPIYSKERIAEADLFLYQIRHAFDLVEENLKLFDEWFSACYIYAEQSPTEWVRIKSKRYCEKIYDLFGVKDIAELKNVIKECTYNSEMGYRGYGAAAPAILNSIKIDEIGSIK